MEPKSTMEKKNLQRSVAPVFKNGQDGSTKTESAARKKNKTSRKKDDNFDYGKRGTNQSGRSGQRLHRPREKMGGQVDSQECEFGSVQQVSFKKQNISHLLDWWTPRETERHFNRNSANHKHRRKPTHQAFNKEHFLQANCQFVVHSAIDYSKYETDPDLITDWDLVEEVRVHRTDPPNCPICLYPPVAAKITRCGHIFCFRCILHYLALSDEKWRKCPICFDAIMKNDLRSVVTIMHQEFNQSDDISFSLMYRERQSLIPNLLFLKTEVQGTFSLMSNISPHSRLILASQDEIDQNIIRRELADLNFQMMTESDQPEACFIEEAIELVNQRVKLLGKYGPSLDLTRQRSETCVHLSQATASMEQMKIHDPINMPCAMACRPQTPEQSNNGPKSIYYFYQAKSGAHIYLNTLNVQMLVKEYGCMENCPQTIVGRIIEKESTIMCENLRSRTRYLGHLPLCCPYDIMELELIEPIISQETLLEFQDRLDKRTLNRKRKEKEEKKVERRAKREEDKIMGRDKKTVNVHLESTAHFPSFSAAATTFSGGTSDGYTSSSQLGSSPEDLSCALSFPKMTASSSPPSQTNRPSWVSTTIPIPKVTQESEEDEDGIKPSSYNSSFSAVLAKAFLEAANKPKTAGRNGGKKKKTRIVLM